MLQTLVVSYMYSTINVHQKRMLILSGIRELCVAKFYIIIEHKNLCLARKFKLVC